MNIEHISDDGDEEAALTCREEGKTYQPGRKSAIRVKWRAGSCLCGDCKDFVQMMNNIVERKAEETVNRNRLLLGVSFVAWIIWLCMR